MWCLVCASTEEIVQLIRCYTIYIVFFSFHKEKSLHIVMCRRYIFVQKVFTYNRKINLWNWVFQQTDKSISFACISKWRLYKIKWEKCVVLMLEIVLVTQNNFKFQIVAFSMIVFEWHFHIFEMRLIMPKVLTNIKSFHFSHLL
jgi:hypothetical protein